MTNLELTGRIDAIRLDLSKRLDDRTAKLPPKQRAALKFIIETAFHNGEQELAIASKHLWPSKLVEELGCLKRPARIYITHLKPGEGAITMAEIEECAEPFNPRMLSNGHVFKL